MDNEATNQAETDQRILTFDVSDDALERAASAEQYIALAPGTTAACHSSVLALAPAAWRCCRQYVARHNLFALGVNGSFNSII